MRSPVNRAPRVVSNGLQRKTPENPKAGRHSLASRALRVAGIRIALVCICAGAVSYFVNHRALANAVRTQLALSTEQALQRDALPFREVKELEENFLDEFALMDASLKARRSLAHHFDAIYYRHPDGSYTQRRGIFEGEPLPDGRRYPSMSATYSPDIPPGDDVKARMTLSFLLSYKYGSAMKGRLFNFYGVVPEKGFPIYQSADIAKVFKYEGPDALRLETYEFYSQGFRQTTRKTLFTRVYWDPSNAAWMTTIATPDGVDASGRHRIMACVDVLLDDLMRRAAKPNLPGSRSTIFADDPEGTLIFDGTYADQITHTGHASIASLNLADYRPLLGAVRHLPDGVVTIVDGDSEIVAVGRIPETPWVLAIHYPKSLMRTAILTNLAIVIALGLLTLCVEIFILRSILRKQVADPLMRLIHATQTIGRSDMPLPAAALPTQSNDEIGQLARDFSSMAERVRSAHDALEQKVQERTLELEQVNRTLLTISMTDEMTGVANRRRFDEVLASDLAFTERTGGTLMLAMIDVDWFKRYNDRYGHPAGDACLRSIARILATNVRGEHDLVARYGGEEFAIVARLSDSRDPRVIGRALHGAIASAEIEHEGSPFARVTLSIGVALSTPADRMTPEGLLLNADRALYRAKLDGRNQTVVIDRHSSGNS